MKTDYIQELGEAFALLSGAKFNISPLAAKQILYSALDDGYGRYFHEIFSPVDRENPYLVQELGSPYNRHTGAVTTACSALAEQFIVERALRVGEWHDTWKDVALTGGVAKQLEHYQPGELGQQFLRRCSANLSFIDGLVAKRALMDYIACGGVEDKIFTDDDRYSFLYSSLMQDASWHPQDLCSEEYFMNVAQKARDFTATTLGMFDEGAPFVGVTFGWPAPNQKEWHLYGELVTTDIFRCKLEDLPGLFGAVSYCVDLKQLKQLYGNTHLCVVAVDSPERAIPVAVNSAYMYTFPTASIVACKWVGKLPQVLGPYGKVAKAIESSHSNSKKECGSNA